MKTVLLYTYFNGIEQLEMSYKMMAHLFDEVVICYQDISNTGNINPNVLKELEQFNCHKIKYNTNLTLITKENERRKHALMIETAKDLKATHFVLSAVDHVYTEQALKVALAKDVDVTFTKMYTYYKHLDWRLEPIEDYYMPFVHKLYNHTMIVNDTNYPVLVDPSVRVNTCKSYHAFNINECCLHHYSMVRTDVMNKFKNSASRGNWSEERLQKFVDEYNNAKLGDRIDYFKGRRLVISEYDISSYLNDQHE